MSISQSPRSARHRMRGATFALLTVAIAAIATLAMPGRAQAQEVKPLVLVIMDTSNSMEYNNGPGAVEPTCIAGPSTGSDSWCADGAPDTSHTKSRMTVAIEALTGQFTPSEYKCCQLVRDSNEPDPLIDHFAVPKTVSQVDNGIMDVYQEDVRFGLISLDNQPDPSVAAAYPSYGYDYKDPDDNKKWNAGAMGPNANRGNHGYNASLERAGGAFQVIPSDTTDLVQANIDLQDELRWLFPSGRYSPIAPALDDAYYYLDQDSDIDEEDCFDKAPKGIILVTDGEVHFDECYPDETAAIDLDGDGDFDDCETYTDDSKTPAEWNHPSANYRTSEYQAARLLNDWGFPTYVIGFNASDAANAKLRSIAAAGGTCDIVDDCIYTADDEQQLRFAFAHIIENLTAQTEVLSRTRPVSTSRTSFRADASGYYEVTAKYEKNIAAIAATDETVSMAWNGHIERVTFKCDNGDMVVDSVVDFADTIEAQSSRTLYTSLLGTVGLYFDVNATLPTLNSVCSDLGSALCDSDLLSTLLTPQLADIYHSNPTIAVAPELDLPLAGYTQFRREWGERDTMLFVGTNDGLLHAITLGDVDGSGDVEGEERWTYIPRTIHSKLLSAQAGHVITVDGTPVIKDVRLFRKFDSEGDVEEKWATVLVGTFRSGGRGVFALDITNPDDPRFLWEHTATDLVNLEIPLFGGGGDLLGDGLYPYARLGNTYGQPAVGSVVVEDTNGDRYETAVAVVPGGKSTGTSDNEGEAIYVFDLYTGDILRVFTGLDSGETMAAISGSAVGYSTVPGTLMNRVFVGDEAGRLLRVDLADPDPANWTLKVFLDPAGDGLLTATTPDPEPAMAAPALSRDRQGNVVVHFGTGDVSSINPVTGKTNFVASVSERIGYDGEDLVVEPDLNWLVELDNGAKLTGSPVVFNNTAYFPTLENTAGTAQCGGDAGRLWAAHYTNTDTNGDPVAMVDLDGDDSEDLYTDFAAGTVIFGLDIAVRPPCFDREVDNGVYSLKNPQPTTPQLVLQTGNPPYGEEAAPDTTTTPVTGTEIVDKVRIDLPQPPTALRTTSWGSIYN